MLAKLGRPQRTFGLAPWYGTWQPALLAGLPAAIVPTLLAWKAPQALASRMAVAIACMWFCALHIHQAMGMVELHFGIFVLLALLVVYQDWRVIIGAAGFVAAHHLLFNFLQQAGFGTMCLSQPSLAVIVVHALYVVVESAALCYFAISDAAQAIASGNQDLSARTGQQAVELVRTSAPSTSWHGRCARMPTMRRLPRNWWSRLPRWRCAAAAWWPKWCRPWGPSTTARAASTTLSR